MNLQAGRAVLGEAFDLEQLVREADDLVALSHGPIIATLSALGVWRSLVARSVRVGEVPSSNLGTPMSVGEPMVPPPDLPPPRRQHRHA